MSIADDRSLISLYGAPQNVAERALAARYAPLICFDEREPFCPLAAGYTLFRQSGTSPSFTAGREITLAPAGRQAARLAIEYAIWWDWDIGHLYELEHAWVYVGQEGDVVRVEASWHGDYRDMSLDGQLALEGDHPVLLSEPGKHAFAPTETWFRERSKHFKRSETGFLAGCGGVLVARYFEGLIAKTPLNDRLARSYLSARAFEPSWRFSERFQFKDEMLVPWNALRDWIPRRVNEWLDRLERGIPPSQYRFLRIGHRGARARAPDNTLSSLRLAAELGADVVEFDVQRTADGQIAVVHDPWLIDSDGQPRPVRQSTLAQLQAVDLGDGERVPTLTEALDLCETENLGAYIEIKDGAAIPGLAVVLLGHDVAPYAIVGSFRPDWLADLKSLVPEIETSILFGSCHVDPVTLARSIGARYVHPCWERFPNPSALLTAEWIAQVRDAGLGIICWHEERADEIAALRQLGVDGICSDDPELLLDKSRRDGR